LAVGLVAGAAACTHPGGPGGGGTGGGEFSVLTYNVAGLPQEISTENPREHIPLISPLLNEYDVVLTQEDFDWWLPILDQFDFVHYHEWLRAEATHPYRSAQHPGPEAVGVDPAVRGNFVGDGNGILSRLPFTGNTRVPWTGCFGGIDTNDGGAGDCLAMKGFAMVTMTLPNGALVDVYTLHAEAGGTAQDQSLQVDDFAQLADFIVGHSAGRAVVIGGDTNLHTDGTHPDASGGADAAIWNDFLARTGLTDACTATGCAEPGSIDKIAYRSGAGVRLEATSHAMPRERFTAPDGEALSDHPPVVVDFRWQARRR
ncbi:MAG TPA: endonuclease/exonuclease/phosphatase family protein, partial [Acidimicrobiales bacterium]|nr:endonuclease/exonuclease/phosphatase family protein [Acidimicrobiales bacterium]